MKEDVKIWQFYEATRIVPYVRKSLQEIRENFILLWHYWRINGNSAKNSLYTDIIHRVREENIKTHEELNRLGVIQYQSPVRGIALFPITIEVRDIKGKTIERGFYVYKDTRSEISSYILWQDLSAYDNIYGWEKAIPDVWKIPANKPAIQLTSK